MKVLIITINADTKLPLTVKGMLDSEVINCTVTSLPAQWDIIFFQGFLERIDSGNKVIYIAHKDDLNSAWLPILAAYIHGKKVPLIVHNSDSNMEIPLYFPEYFCVQSNNELESYFTEQKSFIERIYSVEHAKDQLKHLGYSIYAPMFLKVISDEKISISMLYIKAGMPLEIFDEHGNPALIIAIKTGNTELVKNLLKQSSNIDIENLNSRRTPLMEAASSGFTEILDILIKSGAEINHLQSDGVSALMLAAGAGHSDIVKILLERGADTEIKDQLGMTAREYAALLKKPEIITLLEQ